jgi:cytochrome c peroxidase
LNVAPFAQLLLSETWIKRDWKGPLQYQDKKTKTLMMLPTDLEMIQDPQFKKYTQEFAADEKAFFLAFTSAFKKLLELGVKFPENATDLVL